MTNAARTFAAGALGVILLLFFLQRFVLIELLVQRIGTATVLAAIEALAIIGAGHLARRRAPADVATDFLVGYPIFGAVCFLVALMRVSAATMVPLLLVGAVAGVLAIRGMTRPQELPAPHALALVAMAIVFLCGLVIAQAPPVSLDELAYHLAVPRAWVHEGRAVELPLLSHSYFPLGIESADLPLLTLRGAEGAIASHLLHLCAAIATAMLIHRRTQSVLATAAIVTMPALAITAGWSLVDWPLLGITVVLITSMEQSDDRSMMAAVAAGLLTKYTFIPIAAVAAVVSRRWRVVAIGTVAGSVFLLRNLFLTGNPIAPFLSAHSPSVADYRQGLAGYLFDGRYVDESLGVSTIVLAAGATTPLGWAMLAGAGALLLLGPSSRILIPFLAIPAMTTELRNRAVSFVIGVAVVVQTLLVVWFTERSDAFALIGGRLSDAEYVTQQRPVFTEIGWLNATLPIDSRTLVIGCNETFWFERRVRGGGNFDGPRVSNYIAATTAETLRSRLRRDGITHIAVIDRGIATADPTKLQERQTLLTPAAQKTLSELLAHHAATATTHGRATLFTLR